MIVVVDYKVGNVKSVCNALRHIGCETRLSRELSDIEGADGIILPGVAAFGYAVSELGSTAEAIKEAALAGKPLLGICVGYQLLFERSCEHGEHEGLSLVKGNVVPIPPGRTIPHMGWNIVNLPGDMDLFRRLKTEEYFYFAHSYYANVADSEAKIAYSEYGFKLPASVQKGNIYGVQFHPEKSGEDGLNVLRNFEKICLRNKAG